LYQAEYRRAYNRLEHLDLFESEKNSGVAVAKNTLLRHMLSESDADWLFLLEDDIIIKSPEAITEYIRVAEENGLHHLSFAHHGPANADGPVEVQGDVAYYPHSIGAWCLYSRESLDVAGLFDEHFHNAWEHVEHEVRLMQHGFMPGCAPHRFPDVKDSLIWLSELPNAIDKSAIRPRSDWGSSIINGLRYWHDAKPETFDLMFGPGTPLEQYASNILSQTQGAR
jgi:glycosyltransferase involved in cell wall biosynthesis